MQVNYITSNAGKFAEAKLILPCWNLIHTPLDLPEIQGTSEEIALEKAKKALEIIKSPFIVEDVSLHLSALGGFPGPYIKPMLSVLGPDGLYDLVHRYGDYRATAICHAVYFNPNLSEFILCKGVTEGTLVAPRVGATEHGKINFNSIFMPLGYEKSVIEMPFSEIIHFSMRAHALNQLKRKIDLLCLHAN
mgnify:CR=1 FL=1